MTYYLLIGIGFYIGLAITRRDTFQKATVWSVIKGILLGILLWPVGIYVAYKSEYDKQ